MPTHQFKMAVRKKTVQVGKPIQECTADELETIAFWVETLTTSAATEKSQLGAVYRSHIGDRVEDADEILSGDSRRGQEPGRARCRRGIDGKRSCYCSSFLGGTVSGRSRRPPVPSAMPTAVPHTRSIG